jgi:antitoxin component of MazEF toxin-antitoxin module
MKSEKATTKISKWGNGYGIRVPRSLLALYKLQEGSEVVLQQTNNGLILTPKTPSLADLTLAEIMSGVTPDLTAADQGDSFFGKPQGVEVW